MKTPASAFAASFLLVVACGSSGSSSNASSSGASSSGSSSSSSSNDPASCASVTKTMCEKACACTGDGSCIIAYGFDGGAAATEKHESLEACTNFYALFACGQEKVDWAACAPAIDQAACEPSSQGKALAYPASACKDTSK